MFVSFTVKAVNIQPVSDLTTSAFIATLCQFAARLGKPSTIWNDHGMNFVGAEWELKELDNILAHGQHQEAILNHCTSQMIQWKFIPEHSHTSVAFGKRQ